MNLLNLLFRLDGDIEIVVYKGEREIYKGKSKKIMCDDKVLNMNVNSINPQHTSSYNYLEIYLF